MRRRSWRDLGKEETVDCSVFRLPFERHIRKCESNVIGNYGIHVARQWLKRDGIMAETGRIFRNSVGNKIYPDLYDSSSRIAYEVKTGIVQCTFENRSQLTDYRFAIDSGQVAGVTYVNVAINGRMGLQNSFRRRLRESGIRLVVLT